MGGLLARITCEPFLARNQKGKTMPHFNALGHEEVICQAGAHIVDGQTTKTEWRPDITGNQSAGLVCKACADAHDRQQQPQIKPEPPMSLHEYCHQESGGLTGTALTRYINRYYGHG